jgi:hypothetical protein
MSSPSPKPPPRPTTGSIGDIALNYQAQWGLHIFPGEPEFKEPYKFGMGYRLFSQARQGSPIPPEVLSHFWESYPLSNILMFPGALSGVDVIDVDNKPDKKSGFETLEEIGLSWVIEEGRAASTPTGNGIHLYFKHTDDWGPNKKPPGTGLEVFWAGNQFIPMPPSMFRNPDTGEIGYYEPWDLNLDGLNPIPEELARFFSDSKGTSPLQKQSGHHPQSDLTTMPPANPPPQKGFVPVTTLIRLGAENKREREEANSLKHLAKNTEFPAQVRALQDRLKKLRSLESNPNVFQQMFNALVEEAHSILSSIGKRCWFILDDGWIFKFHGRWHWVGIPGTKHDGIEVIPSPEELASQKGKGRNKYIIRSDGTMLVQFTHHSQSGKSPKVGWYYLYEGEYPELDEFI